MNAEGLVYQQPRQPFAGTIWNGLLNGFPRINQENVRRPRKNRPNAWAYVVVGSHQPMVNGHRRTLAQIAQTISDGERLAEKARVRATKRGADRTPGTAKTAGWLPECSCETTVMFVAISGMFLELP